MHRRHHRHLRHLRTAFFLLVLTFLFARCSAGPTEPILPPSFDARAMALSAVDCDTPEDVGAMIDLLEETGVLNHGRATALRTRLVQAMRHDAAGRTAQAAAAYAQLVAQVAASGALKTVFQPIFDLQSPRIAFGRIALLGDAAFVARPHVATGVMKAALDAQALADMLAADDDVEAALANYDRYRRPFGTWLVARGRHIGAAITERGAPMPTRADTLMREYGAAGVVEGETISAGSGR